MMGSAAFESPLVSHARMRSLFRTLVEVRELSRAARGHGFPKGLEACWVATALELQQGDLASDAGGPWLLEHLRRAAAREGAAITAAEMRRTLRQAPRANAAERTPSAQERMLCAAGQAMALRALGTGAVLAYAIGQTLTTKDWQRILAVAGSEALPLVIVATAGEANLASAASHARVERIPVIPVDAGDALAIHRVAQESLGRARTDGGVAIIECVPLNTDPVQMLAQQLIGKGICTERWINDVRPGVLRALRGSPSPA